MILKYLYINSVLKKTPINSDIHPERQWGPAKAEKLILSYCWIFTETEEWIFLENQNENDNFNTFT